MLTWQGNMADIKSYRRSFSNCKTYFREYCDYTGIHGLKFIGEKRTRLEKIIWCLVFFASLFICAYIVFEVFKKWHRTPIMLNFASNQVNIFDVTFPAVTICPETKVYSDYFNYSYTLRNFKHLNQTLTEETLKKMQYMSLLCDDNRLQKQIPKKDYIDEGFYEFLKTGTPDFLRRCSWMGNETNCQEIFQPFITDEGACFTFNLMSKKEMYTGAVENIEYPPRTYIDRKTNGIWSPDWGYSDDAGMHPYPRRALLSGSVNALEVGFAVNNTDVDYGCTHFQGFKVVLHNPVRFPVVSTHYFRVPLKKSVMVAISPALMNTSVEVAEYSVKKRKCYFQEDYKLKYFAYYSQMNCRLECFLNMTMDSCGCVEYYLPRNKSIPICGTGKEDCLADVKRRQAVYCYKNPLKYYNATEKCECAECLPMCNNVEYNVEITESDYDWPRKMQAIGIDVVTEDDEGMATSEIQIYFKQDMFLGQERTAFFGTFDFLANVGGLLGLFIGFSLLSLVEIIYFFTLRILCNIRLYNSWFGKENQQ